MCTFNSPKKEYFHFSSFLAGFCAIVLLAGLIIFLHVFCPSGESFNRNNMMDFVGLFFTITGVVTGLYFIIMGLFAYRTKREMDEAIDSIKRELEKNEPSRQVYYKILYDYLSERIANDKHNADKYKLSQARLACITRDLELPIRVEKIELLGSVNRSDTTIKEIIPDIKLLSDIISDRTEDEKIIEAAKKSLKKLKEKRSES